MQFLKLIVFVAVFALGGTVEADSKWKMRPSVEKEFDDSNIVIVGTVTSAKDVLEQSGIIQGTFYSIQVAEVLKGSPSKTLKLYSENSSGRYPMKIGVSYLIFAYENVFEGIDGRCFAIDNCGNSGTLKYTEKALATARKLKR